jgi:hypothetical protein
LINEHVAATTGDDVRRRRARRVGVVVVGARTGDDVRRRRAHRVGVVQDVVWALSLSADASSSSSSSSSFEFEFEFKLRACLWSDLAECEKASAISACL